MNETQATKIAEYSDLVMRLRDSSEEWGATSYRHDFLKEAADAIDSLMQKREVTPEQILAKEAPGWSLNWIKSGGGLCIQELKQIWVDEKYKSSLGMLLHEIAHIKHLEHDRDFAYHFTALVDKYTDTKSIIGGGGANEMEPNRNRAEGRDGNRFIWVS